MFKRIREAFVARKAAALEAFRARSMRADVEDAADTWFRSPVRKYGHVWQMARAYADGATAAYNDYRLAREQRWDQIAQYLHLRYNPLTEAEHAELAGHYFQYTDKLFDDETQAKLEENRQEDADQIAESLGISR
jgi:hypothetical protein